MITINVICIGKIKEDFFKKAIIEYSKRLSKFCKLNIIELPDEKLPDKLNPSLISIIKEKECDNIIKHLPKNTYTISLDLKGKEYSSEDFAEKIDNLTLNTSSITFIIGGSLGLTDDILKISSEKICFSKMTFPHQLIRIFLLEQIFRAFKIINGENYHH